MPTYEGENVAAEIWRILQEHRGRKELRKIGAPVLNPKVTPKSDRDRFPDN